MTLARERDCPMTAPCGRGSVTGPRPQGAVIGRRIWAVLAAVLIAVSALPADSKKLTSDQRIELLRGLSAEYATIKGQLPRSKKALEFNADGTWDQTKWKAAEQELGLAGRVGDLIQVTHVEIDKERIVLELGGGAKARSKWYQRIEVGIGTQTRPISQGDGNAPGGTTVALVFGEPMGEMNSADVKKLLLPILDFDKQSVTENYLETLPEPVREAIRAKKALEGMDRDQVLMALGRPLHKNRETKEGTELEDWIYGEPPGRVTFVTFGGNKVVKVKETYAGLGGAVAKTPGP